MEVAEISAEMTRVRADFVGLVNGASRIDLDRLRVGGRVVPTAAMIVLLERTMAGLQRRLDQETEQSLALTMHFPTAWDPYFRPSMSVRDVYRYGTEHYEHHRCQLTVRFP